jgi:hypothetical protein
VEVIHFHSTLERAGKKEEEEMRKFIRSSAAQQ